MKSLFSLPAMVVSLGPNGNLGQPVRVNNTETGETIHIITGDLGANLVAGT